MSLKFSNVLWGCTVLLSTGTTLNALVIQPEVCKPEVTERRDGGPTSLSVHGLKGLDHEEMSNP